jgi:hypothetical protein
MRTLFVVLAFLSSLVAAFSAYHVLIDKGGGISAREALPFLIIGMFVAASSAALAAVLRPRSVPYSQPSRSRPGLTTLIVLSFGVTAFSAYHVFLDRGGRISREEAAPFLALGAMVLLASTLLERHHRRRYAAWHALRATLPPQPMLPPIEPSPPLLRTVYGMPALSFPPPTTPPGLQPTAAMPAWTPPERR